ncbi:MAG: hypothetical protein ACI81Y_002453, partial [Glaciecola sp.]
MKTIITKISFCFIFLCCSVGFTFAQTFCLDMQETSNDGDTSIVSIRVQGDASFVIGSSNLQLAFSDGAFGTPTLVSSPLAPPWYQPTTVTEPGAGLISVNIELSTSNVSGTIAAAPAFTEVAVIKLPILNSALAANGVTWEYNGLTTQTVVFLDDEATQLFATSPGCLTGYTPSPPSAIPFCPSLTSPVNFATQVPSAAGVIFDWVLSPSGTPATAVDFLIGLDPDPLTMQVIPLAGTPETVTIIGTAFATTYYWSIVPSNVTGSAAGCTVYSFTTEDTPPGGLNNTCALADTIAEGIFSDLGPLAGNGATDNCFGSGNTTHASWYRYFPSATGVATISSSIDLTEPDTRVSVFAHCDSTTCLAFDDDAGEGFTSITSLQVTAGESYVIEWDDRWAAGPFDFEVSLVPDVLGCTDALACNYNVAATDDDLSCILPTGCDTCSGETDGTGTVVDNPEVGDACDDLDPTTTADEIGIDCICAGIPDVPILGCLDAAACNYNDLANTADACIYSTGCDTCSGETDGTGTVVDNLEIGDACDDGDALTTGEQIGADCICAVLTGVDCASALIAVDGVQTSPGTLAIGGTPANICFGGTAATGAVWYAYVATSTDTLVVSSSIDLDLPDTRVNIFDDCPAVACVGGDDDGGEGFTSIAGFVATAGETYYLEWDDRWDDGEFDFEIRPRIAGCIDATACNFNAFSEVEADICIYTDSLSCDVCSGEFDGTGTVIDNPEIGTVCDDGDANTLDDEIGLDCICAGIPQVVNGCDDPLACNYNSATTIASITCIYVDPLTCDSCSGDFDGTGFVIDNPEIGEACNDGDPNTGNDVIEADCVTCTGSIGPGEDCANAIPVGDGITSDADINGGGGATNACHTGGTNAVWYVYTASCTGFTTVSSEVDSLDLPDTRIAIHSACDTLDCIDFDDDGGAGFTSVVTFPTVAGEDYYLEWDDRWDDGVFDFEITCAPALLGCTDPTACNFNDTANTDDLTCIIPTGCDTCTGETDGTGTVIDNPEIGDVCDDGDANTVDDIVNGGCFCAGTPLASCQDASACNFNSDILLVSDPALCVFPTGCDACSGQTDGTGIVIDNPEVGEACDDGNVTTLNDVVQVNCSCAGTVGNGPGTSCLNAITITDGIHTSLGTDTIGGGGASDSCFTGGTNAIWYVYTALVCDTVTVTSQVDSLDLPDTRISIHSSCATFDCIASDDDAGPGF